VFIGLGGGGSARKAVTVLLDHPAYAEGARRLKAENDASHPPSARVAMMEKLVV
jgi:hypothetical protein